ncbi:hypothetical protein Ptr902_05420 [Pyrenophora tritici-repentis]|nr:hypothetical protein Ptr902_05420 [Pyrenophora tritici-repentis]
MSPHRFIVLAITPDDPNIKTIKVKVRVSTLQEHSPLFSYIEHISHVPTTHITLPNTSPLVLTSLIHWLKTGNAPPHLSAASFPFILKHWVLARALGLWRYQNACIRLGLSAMQSKHSICEIETVKWVYENTHPGSTLRDFVIKIFCQRGGPVTKGVFSKGVEELGIVRDLSYWLWVLEKARGIPEKTLKKPDWTGELYPLPEFLVFDETGNQMPDKFHFVGDEGAFWGAEAVAKQLGLC